jgi:hypothetical protein
MCICEEIDNLKDLSDSQSKWEEEGPTCPKRKLLWLNINASAYQMCEHEPKKGIKSNKFYQNH